MLDHSDSGLDEDDRALFDAMHQMRPPASPHPIDSALPSITLSSVELDKFGALANLADQVRETVRLTEPADWLEGDRVMLSGLVGATALNLRCGRIVAPRTPLAEGRCAVELEDGEDGGFERRVVAVHQRRLYRPGFVRPWSLFKSNSIPLLSRFQKMVENVRRGGGEISLDALRFEVHRVRLQWMLRWHQRRGLDFRFGAYIPREMALIICPDHNTKVTGAYLVAFGG